MRIWLSVVLVAALGLWAPAPAHAQTSVSLGPTAGINFANVRDENLDDPLPFSTLTGIVAGGFVALHPNDRMAVRLEFLYAQKGTRILVDTGVEGTIKLKYVQLPLVAQVRFPGRTLTPFLMAGPSLAFKTACKFRLMNGQTTIEGDCDDANFDANFDDPDLGFIVGAGMEVGALQVSLRYDHSFSNLATPTDRDAKVTNRAFSVMLALGFPLGAG